MLVVAWSAEIVSAEAVEGCGRAAEHALVQNVLFAMGLALSVLFLDVLESAGFADQVFRALLLSTHFLDAVNHAAEVRFLAFMALIEGAAVHSQALKVSEVWVALGGKSVALVKALLSSFLEGFFFDLCLQLTLFVQFLSDLGAVVANLDFLFAARAIEVGESNTCCGPSVFEQVENAVGVKYVATVEANGCLSSNLCGEADGAQLVGLGHLGAFVAERVHAGKALALVNAAVAAMAAFWVFLSAALDLCLSIVVIQIDRYWQLRWLLRLSWLLWLLLSSSIVEADV